MSNQKRRDAIRAKECRREVLETELELSGYDFVDAAEIARSLVQANRWARRLRIVKLEQQPQARQYFQQFAKVATDKQLAAVANMRDEYDYVALWADCELIARDLDRPTMRINECF